MSIEAVTAVRRSAFLFAILGGLWCLLAVPVYRFMGRSGLEEMALSAVLCLLPGWLVFCLAARYRVAKTQALAMLAGGTLRLVCVLGAVGCLWAWHGAPPRRLLLWLVVYYCAALAVETALVVRPNWSSPRLPTPQQ